MHCDPEFLRKAQIDSVKRRIGQYDISDSAVSFKSDRHVMLLLCADVTPDAVGSGMIGRSLKILDV
jgi:hypothetical protein